MKQVVAGDNAKYQTYIEAHNHATDASRKAVEKLIPAAEKTGVVIALENVWNNLWVKPAIFANFVASFDSPWVQAYFDIGNHVKYAPPEEWIRALGKLIVKCHVKDFKLNAGRPRRRFRRHPRRQRQLAGRPQGARRGRLQRLDDDRRQRRPVAGGTQPAAGPDHRREVTIRPPIRLLHAVGLRYAVVIGRLTDKPANPTASELTDNGNERASRSLASPGWWG